MVTLNNVSPWFMDDRVSYYVCRPLHGQSCLGLGRDRLTLLTLKKPAPLQLLGKLRCLCVTALTVTPHIRVSKTSKRSSSSIGLVRQSATIHCRGDPNAQVSQQPSAFHVRATGSASSSQARPPVVCSLSWRLASATWSW